MGLLKGWWLSASLPEASEPALPQSAKLVRAQGGTPIARDGPLGELTIRKTLFLFRMLCIKRE